MVDTVPFPAYRGSGEFVFVSYAHHDSAVVFPIVETWHRAGVAIWFDEGIQPGREWPQEIGEALVRASRFIVFITPASVRSVHVRNEIGLAADVGKPILAIHLKETDLPAGLQLRLNQTQAVHRYQQTEAEFESDVRGFFFRTASLPPFVASAKPARSKWSTPAILIAAAGLFLVLMMVVFRGRSTTAKAETLAPSGTADGAIGAAASATPTPKLTDGELALPTGLLHFVSEGNPMENVTRLRLGDRDVFGNSPPTSGGSVEWFDADADGSYRVLVLNTSAGNACVGMHQLLRIRRGAVETWSEGFGGCKTFARVEPAPGGLDFLFGGGLLGKMPRARLREGQLTDEDGAALRWASSTLLGRAGQHPAELLVDADIGARFRRLLGPLLDDFAGSLTVASNTEVLDDLLVGSGCAAHECGSRESALFVDPYSEAVYAATLRGGVATVYLPSEKVDLLSHLNEWVLQQWRPQRTVRVSRTPD